MPNHCSAPQAWYRSTSVKPNFAARRIERALAVWVLSTTGSPGSASSSQPSAAAHASAAYPNPPRPRQEQVTEASALRAEVCCSLELDLADHGSVEINYEMAGVPPGHLRHLALKLVTRPRAAEVGAHLRRSQQLEECRTVPGLGLSETRPLQVLIGSGGQVADPRSSTRAGERDGQTIALDDEECPARSPGGCPRPGPVSCCGRFPRTTAVRTPGGRQSPGRPCPATDGGSGPGRSQWVPPSKSWATSRRSSNSMPARRAGPISPAQRAACPSAPARGRRVPCGLRCGCRSRTGCGREPQRWRAAVLSWAMSSRLAARAAARSSSCVLGAGAQVDGLLFEVGDPGRALDVVGGADADSRHTCSPRTSDSRLRAADRAVRRVARSSAASRSACSDARVTAGPAAGDRGRSGGLGVDLGEEVAVAVEEGAVDAGSRGRWRRR